MLAAVNLVNAGVVFSGLERSTTSMNIWYACIQVCCMSRFDWDRIPATPFHDCSVHFCMHVKGTCANLLHPQKRGIQKGAEHAVPRQVKLWHNNIWMARVQVMGAMLTVAIFVGWLYIMSMTAIKAWQGHLFRAYSPSQPMADLRSAHPAHSPATNGVNGV